jgi:hypothetical protein
MSSDTDEHLLQRLVSVLSAVPGVSAVVLGGSRARGTATAHSDYDIGLYYKAEAPHYKAEAPLDVAALGRAATTLDDGGPTASVTPVGGWGPWINGGGWLMVAGRKVDLLYRDLARVRTVIDECHAGQVSVHYQPGHPHAFVSAIYMGEVACCRVLHDPAEILAPLKQLTEPYPPRLQGSLIRTFAGEADFALQNARKSLDRQDVAYISSCCSRSIACLCQVLFAMNGRYLLNEKRAVEAVNGFTRRPAEFGPRVTAVFRDVGLGLFDLAIEGLEQLVHEAAAPRVNLPQP